MSVCLSVCPCTKLWGNLETSKMIRFGWNFAHFFLGWIPGDFFHFFKTFDFWGFRTSFFSKMRLKLWGSLETFKMVGFGWNFAHLFLGWISEEFFHLFKNFDFWGLVYHFWLKTRLKLWGQLETSKMIGFGSFTNVVGRIPSMGRGREGVLFFF